jgi:multidrug efflux pump subunit AcrB
MKFTDIFLRRPVLAIVVNLVILIAGLQAIGSLSVRQYPKIESATITVKTVYVGASADLVRGFVTMPLERSIAAADGIDYIESQSQQGLSQINVRLKLTSTPPTRSPTSAPASTRSGPICRPRRRCPPSRSSPPTRRSRAST